MKNAIKNKVNTLVSTSRLINRKIVKLQLSNLYSSFKQFQNSKIEMKSPLTVSLTGASGNIGYAIAFRIAAGDMLGPNQPIDLQMIDIPEAEDKMIGVKLELEDCSLPTLNSITTHTSLSSGFKECDIAIIIGVADTIKGGERLDGLKANAVIMKENAKALNENAKRSVKVLTIGNPVNTNCLIMAKNAPNLKMSSFNAMSRLDHNRAIHKLADLFKVHVSSVEKVFIWGNHDATMYPELEYGLINGKSIKDLVKEEFLHKEFINFVSQRWKEIVHYRCLTSCASAANSAIDHMRDWCLGTDRWISMAVHTDGKIYGIPKDLYFSLPCVVESNEGIDGKIKVIDDLTLTEFTKEKLKITTDSLINERKMIENYL